MGLKIKEAQYAQAAPTGMTVITKVVIATVVTLCIAGLAIGLGVGLSRQKNNNNNDSNSPSPSPSPSPTFTCDLSPSECSGVPA